MRSCLQCWRCTMAKTGSSRIVGTWSSHCQEDRRLGHMQEQNGNVSSASRIARAVRLMPSSWMSADVSLRFGIANTRSDRSSRGYRATQEIRASISPIGRTRACSPPSSRALRARCKAEYPATSHTPMPAREPSYIRAASLGSIRTRPAWRPTTSSAALPSGKLGQNTRRGCTSRGRSMRRVPARNRLVALLRRSFSAALRCFVF